MMGALARVALGTMTSTSSSVTTFVARQLISMTRPMWVFSESNWIQSSTSKGRCTWMARPATMLPRVSWRDRAMAAVSSAEVVRSWPGSTPAVCSVTSRIPTQTRPCVMSRTMTGSGRRPRRPSATSKTRSTRLLARDARRRNVAASDTAR
jgi:hypothetical protein